jgi:HigB_toxin, RelE-like toxic component of a toxin-antitoxin system
LRSWYQVARQARWQRFLDVRAFYGSADQVGKFTVFNIAGNKYRKQGRVYSRLTAASMGSFNVACQAVRADISNAAWAEVTPQ